jgi:hypothetical protein
MKRIVCGILAAMLALSLAGCVFFFDPNAAEEPLPTDQVVDLPPSAAPTEAPVTGIKDYFAVIELGSSLDVDIDFDGKDETISVIEKEDEDEGVTITMVEIKHGGSTSAFGFVTDEARVAVLDFDETDSTLDVLACWKMPGGDWYADCLRKVEGESGYSSFSDRFGFSLPADYVFRSEEGLPVIVNTDLLGTYQLNANYTLTDEGFVPIGGVLYYPGIEDPDNAPSLLLERELRLRLVSPITGAPTGETATVPAGETIYPYSTDLESFVIVRLEDGRYGMAELAVENTEDGMAYLINGANQDEYGEIPYAG